MFFGSFTKCSGCSSYVHIIAFQLLAPILINNSTFYSTGSLPLGHTHKFFSVLFSLKLIWMLYLPQKLFPRPCMYGMTMYPLDLLLLLLLFLLLLIILFHWTFLYSIVSSAHEGCLHFIKNSLKCSFSDLSSSGMELPVLCL